MLRVAPGEQHAAEAARVVQAQFPAGIQADGQVIVAAPVSPGVHHAQAAGHAEMQDQRPLPLDLQQQVLAPPRGGNNARALEFIHRPRHRPTQAPLTHFHRGDTRTHHVGCDPPQGGFHFRQLWHNRIPGSKNLLPLHLRGPGLVHAGQARDNLRVIGGQVARLGDILVHVAQERTALLLHQLPFPLADRPAVVKLPVQHLVG